MALPEFRRDYQNLKLARKMLNEVDLRGWRGALPEQRLIRAAVTDARNAVKAALNAMEDLDEANRHAGSLLGREDVTDIAHAQSFMAVGEPRIELDRDL